MDATGLDFPAFNAERATELLAANTGPIGGLPHFLQMVFVEVQPGRIVCELPVTEALLNPFGAAHGGVISALVDHALGTVVSVVVPPGSWPATSEYKLNLLAPARVGPMRATSIILALSKRTAVVRIDVTNNGRLVGAAQGTVTIMPPRAPEPK
jgi:1,4-dihydroxy-2-naphthoyl-CoA hydrolase